MVTKQELEKFHKIRDRLFDGINHYFGHSDGHCKSYEGAMAIHFPNYFQERGGQGVEYAVSLDCYVIGPSRHYSWEGATLMDALNAAEKDIEAWVTETMKHDYEDVY